MSELTALREQAIKEDKAYGVTRLREEFRMKPSPGVAPAYYHKNPYGSGENPCYKVSDCVPLREVSIKEPTEKQLLARKISGLKSTLRSKEALASKKAASWLSLENILSLDTETTGLGENAQIIEIALSNVNGDMVYCQRFKPSVDIEEGAYEKHGISASDLENEPTWDDSIEEIKTLLEGRPIIIFNSEFDIRLIQQTNQAYDLDNDWVNHLETLCAMYLSVEAFGSTNSYGTISLATSTSLAGVVWEGEAHSAEADAKVTMGLVKSLAEYWNNKNIQLEAFEKAAKKLK